MRPELSTAHTFRRAFASFPLRVMVEDETIHRLPNFICWPTENLIYWDVEDKYKHRQAKEITL